ncbi:hypothetical protein E4U41_003880 [Claviceps citrina]|nr:hypothetical protein E4U41_003880 [Claviceps citrina]
MGDEKAITGERISIRPDSDIPEALEEDARLQGVPGKGKGKAATLLSINQVQSSGGALLGSAVSDLRGLRTPGGQKGSENSRTSSSFEAHQSIYGTQGLSNCEILASSSRTFKLDDDVRYAKGADANYNAFARGNGLNGLIHLEHLVAQSPDTAGSLEQSSMDGVDVAELLSQPEKNDISPLSEDDDPTSLEAARLQETIFLSGNAWPFWDQLLNLNADFLVRPDLFAAECEAYLGISNLTEARSIWLQQWNDVLSSYTDEVWGNLGALAKDAKSELVKLEQDVNGTPSVKALERLRLLLAHVRGH